MSTSLLYHGWGVRGYHELAIGFHDAAIRFTIEQNTDTFCCSHCHSRAVMKAGQVPRQFRSLPIGGKPVWIELSIQRLWCTTCGKTRQAKVAFADQGRGYTHSFERYALDLSRHTTIQAVARHLGVGWDAIKDIQKRRLLVRFKKPRPMHIQCHIEIIRGLIEEIARIGISPLAIVCAPHVSPHPEALIRPAFPLPIRIQPHRHGGQHHRRLICHEARAKRSE